MKTEFGRLPDGRTAMLYTISSGKITAKITDLGATLVQLWVPDKGGNMADVVLGYDTPQEYIDGTTFFGATVGRNANRVAGAQFPLDGKQIQLSVNDNGVHNLHSGPNAYKNRLWEVVRHDADSIRMRLISPHGDQGYPGNAEIHVTYGLEQGNALYIRYDAIADRDTVFNMTNHTYFNLSGHEHPELAMGQTLSMSARHFTPDDALNIPTGELRSVEGTPFDFRKPKPIGQDIGAEYDALILQNGYDHNFEVFTSPCAILCDPNSGRTMATVTDCCGVQLYTGNFLENEPGKGGVVYTFRGGVCLETQFYPDSVNHPEWLQPFFPAGQPYHSETRYIFSW